MQKACSNEQAFFVVAPFVLRAVLRTVAALQQSVQSRYKSVTRWGTALTPARNSITSSTHHTATQSKQLPSAGRKTHAARCSEHEN
jgi:hypothetical protein